MIPVRCLSYVYELRSGDQSVSTGRLTSERELGLGDEVRVAGMLASVGRTQLGKRRTAANFSKLGSLLRDGDGAARSLRDLAGCFVLLLRSNRPARALTKAQAGHPGNAETVTTTEGALPGAGPGVR